MNKLLAGVVAVLFIGGCSSLETEPLSKGEITAQVKDDLKTMFSDQDAVYAPITLEEAIARSIKHNLNNRVAMMEETIARGNFELASYDMLPKLSQKAGYTSRSKYTGATSKSLDTGLPYLAASTSQDKQHWTSKTGMTWNVLDFGVSYASAKQSGDQYLITQQLQRKSVQNIVLDVQVAWWRAAVSQRLLGDIDLVLEDTKSALLRSRELEVKKLKSPTEAINDQKTLMDLLQRLLSLKKQMSKSLVELASLMNLRPGTKFSVAIPEEEVVPTLPDMPMLSLEEVALTSRPDVFESNYNKRISIWETRKTILKLFPGIEFGYDHNFDNNSFTVHKVWQEAAVRLSFDILNIFTYPERYKQSLTYEELMDLKRMALSMAVMSQVHIAWQEYREFLSEYYIANTQVELEGKLKKISEASKKANRGNELEAIVSKARDLNARLTKGLALAELHSSVGRIYNTIGIDQMPEEVVSYDLMTFAESIRFKLDSARAQLMISVENAMGESLPEVDRDDNETTFNKLFKLLSSTEPEPAMTSSFLDGNEIVKVSDLYAWIPSGRDLAAKGKYASAIGEWSKGIRTLPVTEKLLRVGKYRAAFPAFADYEKVPSSFQPFVVTFKDKAGEQSYWLFAVPLQAIEEISKNDVQAAVGSKRKVDIVELDAMNVYFN